MFAALASALALANDPSGSWLSYAAWTAPNEGTITLVNTTWVVPSDPKAKFGSNAPGAGLQKNIMSYMLTSISMEHLHRHQMIKILCFRLSSSNDIFLVLLFLSLQDGGTVSRPRREMVLSSSRSSLMAIRVTSTQCSMHASIGLMALGVPRLRCTLSNPVIPFLRT